MSEVPAIHPCPQDIHSALQRAAREWPDSVALVMGSERVTYAELCKRVEVCSAALSKFGITKGDRVALCLGNGTDWAVLFYALGSLGAITVPVNTRLQAEEIRYTLAQSRSSVLFVVDQFLKIDFIEVMRRVCPAIDLQLPDPQLPDLHSIVVLGSNTPAGAMNISALYDDELPKVAPVCAPDDPFLIQYTSGTTSFPKGALLTQRGMLCNAYWAGARFGLRHGDNYLSARPFFHVAGSTLSLLAALQHGATLVTMERFDPAEALRIAEAECCTLVSGNDTMFLMLLGQPELGERKLCLRGGWAAATPAVMQAITERLGARETVVAYGLSEASPNVAMSSFEDLAEDRIAGVMRIQPGLDVRIVDQETDTIVPAGATGEIRVKGWSVMLGYFDKPEETARTFDANGYLRTGDLGRLTEDGRLVFVGRAKEIIRVGGENVAPAEIENMLHEHPDVRHAQVFGLPDKRLIEVPAGYVVLKEGATIDEAALLAWCRKRMAGFKVPRYLRIVESFESLGMTASSKVQKSRLAEHAMRELGLAPQ